MTAAAAVLEVPPVTAKEITASVVRSLFPPRYWAVCPNVSWGLLPWEADILALSPSGVLHEVEVKVSLYDLRRDVHKSKWGKRPPGEPPWRSNNIIKTVKDYVHRFWYAVPPGGIGTF